MALIAAVLIFYITNVITRNDRYSRGMAALKQEDAALHEKQARLTPVYEAMVRAAGCMEGVVCWGDESLTDARETSLPEQLANRIGDALFAPLFDDMTAYAGPNMFRRSLIPVVNMGVADEGMSEILARAGAQVMVVGWDFTMSENLLAKDIEILDEAGRTMLFAKQRHAQFGRATIAGVEGDLYAGSEMIDAKHPRLAFGRRESGSAQTVPAGTQIYTESQEKYRGYRTVLFFREHPEIGSEALVQRMRTLLARQTGNEDQYAVVCTTAEGSELDGLLKDAFGDHYVRNDRPQDQMGVSFYISLSERVYAVLDRYGTFDEVRAGAAQARSLLDVLE